MTSIRPLATLSALACLAPLALAQVSSVAYQPAQITTIAGYGITTAAPMMRGDTVNTNKGYVPTALFTVGETIGTYTPVGLLDGIGAIKRADTLNVYVNHELGASVGYPYTLKNGTVLTGGRVSQFNISRQLIGGGVAVVSINRASLAYDTVYDRQGAIVTSAGQISGTNDPDNGFARFCSSVSVASGTYGLVDNVYFTGEESDNGSVWAIDLATRAIWGVPAMGRGAWENVCPLDSGDPAKVAFLLADDTAGVPLYLYIGQKNAIGDGSFLDRNGLAVGKVYAWKADNGDLSPQQFNGLNSVRAGTWVEVTIQDVSKAGQAGYDAFGYANDTTLYAEADALGCFSFSRPEDLAPNPFDGTQAVFSSTGRGQLYPADNWGTTYVVDTDFQALTASLTIVNDPDSLPSPVSSIRSADNNVWGLDGKLYIQEDRSTSPSSLFGANGIEASMWQLDPVTRKETRVLEIDRSTVPAGQVDVAPTDVGNWESSGVLDVTDLLPHYAGERLYLIDVEAHSIPLGTSDLVEGGQLLLVSKFGND